MSRNQGLRPDEQHTLSRAVAPRERRSTLPATTDTGRVALRAGRIDSVASEKRDAA